MNILICKLPTHTFGLTVLWVKVLFPTRQQFTLKYIYKYYIKIVVTCKKFLLLLSGEKKHSINSLQMRNTLLFVCTLPTAQTNKWYSLPLIFLTDT